MADRTEASSKLLLTVQEAATQLGLGRTLMYELISTGQVPSVQIGRLRRVRPADLAAYAEGLASADVDDQPDAAA